MKEQAEALKKYHRYTNYMSAAMLYLKDNFELKHKLTHDHIKHRILGHWGTVPGLNFIYGGLNYLIKNELDESLNVMLISGPGHGAPAILAGLYLDEALKKYYPEATLDSSGFEYMIKYFSWPSGFPSHTYPGLPGQIHEGGELGYSLGTAFGTVLDRPDLLNVCIVGDGEAETGTLSASWQSNKFLNHKNDGVVLPILHLNGYKISGPTLFACMTDKEINQYFTGLGYDPIFVDQYKLGDKIYEEWLQTLKLVNNKINSYRKYGGKLPLIVLKTMKGWTGPEFNGDKKIEDNNLSHGIPLKNPKVDKGELKIISDWLESYEISELLDKNGKPVQEILDLIPTEERRVGNNKYASGDPGKVKLVLPDLEKHQESIKSRGMRPESGMVEIAEYFKDVLILNRDAQNFRVFSPDESESNFLEPIFEETCRVCSRDYREHDTYYAKEGRMLEILSENVLQAWMEGYIKTGRYGVLVSYEAFLGIINSQIDQYLKYLKQSEKFYWRKSLSSLNYIATSTSWRQDHNGFSHQNPSLINTLITKQSDNTSVYFPVDVNTLLVCMEECMKKVDSVNLIVTGKTDLPQWLNLEEAREHVKNGISIWQWAGNTKNMAAEIDSREDHVDVVLSSAGDYQTRETLAACKILKQEVPELKFQYVNVNEISRLGLGDEHNPVMTQQDVNKYYTKTKPVVFNFHGYPEVIKSLTWGTTLANRMVILGYIEEGSTTTAFDMQVVNKTSRYHVCIQAVLAASKTNKIVDHHAERLIQKWQGILDDHKTYIFENADDMPIVKDFDFGF